MSKKSPAPLSIPNMPRKGEAAPAMESLDNRATISSNGSPPPQRLSSRVQATIAVTVRLDEQRYERMKSWGLARRITNQEVIVAALNGFFDLSDSAREDAIASLRR